MAHAYFGPDSGWDQIMVTKKSAAPPPGSDEATVTARTKILQHIMAGDCHHERVVRGKTDVS